MTQKSRSWCITRWKMPEFIENKPEGPLEDDPITHSQLENHAQEIFKIYEPYRYICIGLEICPDTKKRHWHIYVEFKNARSFSAIKKLDDESHIESRKGSPKQAETYVKKDGLWFEDGEPLKQGKRTDLDLCREMIIEDGFNMRDNIMSAKSIQSVKTCEVLLKYFEKKRTWKPEVWWFYGKSGIGKSKIAREILEAKYGDYWVSSKNLQWWEGYDGHQGVIIDDFRADFCTFHELLRILDRYEYRIEVKGSSRQLLAEHIIITCPKRPEFAYNNRSDEDITQLIRRITKTIEISEQSIAQDKDLYELLTNGTIKLPDATSVPELTHGTEVGRVTLGLPTSEEEEEETKKILNSL